MSTSPNTKVTSTPTPSEEMFYLPPPKIRGPKEESYREKMSRKIKENPMVPAGAVVTAGILIAGLFSMKSRNTALSQKLMRARVAAQGLTIFALVGGMLWAARDD